MFDQCFVQMNLSGWQNGWVKLNIDTAIFASSGRSGVGAANGDRNGQFVVALMCCMDRILVSSHRASRTLHDQTGGGVRRCVSAFQMCWWPRMCCKVKRRYIRMFQCCK